VIRQRSRSAIYASLGPTASVGAASSSRDVALAFLASLLAFSLCFVYLQQSATTLELTARAAQLRASVERAEQVNRTLEIRRAATLSLERIAELAADMGMAPPRVVHRIRVHDTPE